MTTINNDDFKVEKVEKKAPAKKTPRVEAEAQEATLDVESIALENQERIDKVVDNTKILSKNLKEYTMRLNSMHEKNDTLQEKLEILDVDSVKIVFPNHTLKALVTRQIMKVNNQLMNSIHEANDTLAEFGKVEMIEKLDNVDLIDKMTKRVDDLENTVENSNLDDLAYDIESEVQNQLDNCYYVEEDEVRRMIDDSLDGLVLREDIDHDLKIYGREINELKARLNNTLYNKLSRLVKRMFSYNLSNKVRAIFKRNKKKAVSNN